MTEEIDLRDENVPSANDVAAELRKLGWDIEHLGFTAGPSPSTAAELAAMMDAALRDVQSGGGHDIDLSY